MYVCVRLAQGGCQERHGDLGDLRAVGVFMLFLHHSDHFRFVSATQEDHCTHDIELWSMLSSCNPLSLGHSFFFFSSLIYPYRFPRFFPGRAQAGVPQRQSLRWYTDLCELSVCWFFIVFLLYVTATFWRVKIHSACTASTPPLHFFRHLLSCHGLSFGGGDVLLTATFDMIRYDFKWCVVDLKHKITITYHRGMY